MFRTLTLLSILTALLLGIGWFFGGFVGLTMALIFSIFVNFISYWYSDKIVLNLYRAVELKDKKIDQIVENLVQESQIPKPKLYVIDKTIPNAFATGRNPQNAAIAVTKGLLEFSEEEIEGVLAHEIAHIKNNDILIGSIAAMIAGAISYIAQIGYWSLFGQNSREQGNILGVVLIAIFAPLAALLVRSALSRGREYQADLTGALITKNPHALSNALKKISQVAKNYPIRGSAATGHLWIVNPLHADWFTHLFSTHPPVEKRIARLEQMESRLDKEDYGE